MASSISKSADSVSEPVTVPPLYRRIHVQDSSQFSLLYRLLESYLTDPERASSVKELVIQPESLEHRRSGMFRRPEHGEMEARENGRDVAHESLLYRAVDRLGFRTETDKECWVRSLTWMKPEVVDQWTSELIAERASGAGSYAVQYFVDLKNTEFAYCASALLLILCPNIERLVYRDNDFRNVIQETLRRNNYGTLSETHLSRLKEVVLLCSNEGWEDDGRYYNFMDILDLLRMFHRLPSIECLSAEAVDSNQDAGYEGAFPPATANLKRINITHAAFGTDVIGALARAPKALEEFKFTTGRRATVLGGSNMRFAKEIGKALSRQRSSLRKLDLDIDEGISPSQHWYDDQAEREKYAWIDADEYPVPEEGVDSWKEIESKEHIVDELEGQGPLELMKLPDDQEYGNTIGSLRDFERLTHFSIGVSALFGRRQGWGPQDYLPLPFKLIDALPPTLEYLLIRGYTKGQWPEVDEQIEELLKSQPERLPRLEHIAGIEECVPSGQSVTQPDRHPELLWPFSKIDPTWVEVESEPKP